MKRWLCFALFLGFFSHGLNAAITDPQVVQEKTVMVHFSTTVPVSANPAIIDLISLATATGVFPHKETGEIDISQINISIDKLAASSGTVKVGVIDFVGSSTGSVTFFDTYSFLRNVNNTFPVINPGYGQAFYRCRVNPPANTLNNGTTPFILSNDTKNGSTAYTLTTIMASPISAGSVNPRPGDIVLEAVNSDITNTYNIVGDIFYHSEAR